MATPNPIIDNKRRVLLLAIGSWIVVGLQHKTLNPLAGAFNLLRLASSGFNFLAKASFPVAKLSFKWSFKFIFKTIFSMIKMKNVFN